MKTITRAVVISLILLIVAVTLTAGCVQTGDENTTATPSTSGEAAQVLDPDILILGDWKYTFTTNSGETTMVYHFDKDNTGTFSTGKSTTGIHWIYEKEKNSYMINYDKLQQQEDMVIILQDGKYYLCSLGGGYNCERVE